MNTLARYLEMIVDPTFDEFHVNRSSARLAFLTAVAIYHSVDRVAEETGKRTSHLRQLWCRESVEFNLIDIIAHHLKHVKSSDERIPETRPGIPIKYALGFNEAGGKRVYPPGAPAGRAGPIAPRERTRARTAARAAPAS
jgi:hypothetical protein